MTTFRQLWLLTVFSTGLAALLAPATSFAAKEPKKRVAVVAFENKAGYSSKKLTYEWGDLGNGMSEKLVEELINTEKFVVLERQDLAAVLKEQNLQDTEVVAPSIRARLTSAQALIIGTITNVEATGGDEGGTKIGSFKVGGKQEKVSIKVNLRIVDTTTGQVIQSKTVTGTARKKGLRIIGKSTDLKTERKVPIGDATDKAVREAVKQIVAGMDRIPWQGNVARVSGRQVFVNAGLQENVELGLRLRVFERGAELIDSDTNESLGRLDEEIGIIEIQRVEARFSVARVIEGAGFAKGNVVRPANRSLQ